MSIGIRKIMNIKGKNICALTAGYESFDDKIYKYALNKFKS